MSMAIDAFIEEARAVTVLDAAVQLKIPVTSKPYAGPCPHCGGKDRFSINPTLQAFNCRQCGGKGRDGIALMALAHQHDLGLRSGFLGACADALGRSVPEDGERETHEQQRERLARISAQRERNASASQASEAQQRDFRARAVSQARGLYLQAPARPVSPILDEYLYLRTGFRMHDAVYANLRLQPNATYWHGRDDRGYEVAFYAGPAMIAPFVTLDGLVTGSHQTWIDLRNSPKFRARLLADDGQPLPAKKMRGAKKGSLIPLFGLMSSRRWVGGEGIENGLAIAGAEAFRPDTFYFAAGDLGNLAGPADPSSSFLHPSVKLADKRGRLRRITVAGPLPKPDQAVDDAMQVAPHVTQLVLLADGDSEIVATAAAMARAEARMSETGRSIETWWPPAETDFAELMAKGN